MSRTSWVIWSHIVVIAHDEKNNSQRKDSNSNKHHMIGIHCKRVRLIDGEKQKTVFNSADSSVKRRLVQRDSGVNHTTHWFTPLHGLHNHLGPTR